MCEPKQGFWGDITIKQTLFLIIWTAGIIGWIYFAVGFQDSLRLENWTMGMVHQLEQRRENKTKDVGLSVGGNVYPPSTEKQDTPIEETAAPKNVAQSSGSIEEIIYKYFKDDYQIAKAVFMAESRLNQKAKGYNCYYNGKSQACRAGDEHLAWSVDCGVAQLNVRGKDCPENLYNPDENLRLAREKYDSRRWQPWSAFTNKKYLAFL